MLSWVRYEHSLKLPQAGHGLPMTPETMANPIISGSIIREVLGNLESLTFRLRRCGFPLALGVYSVYNHYVLVRMKCK